MTRPLEAALQVLPVLETRSFTNQGTAEIELDFDPASDPRADLQNVQAIDRRDPSRASRAVTRIETVIQHPSMEPIASYALTATSLSQAQLRLLVEQTSPSRSSPALPGLGRVTVFAGPGVEYRVTLDPRRWPPPASTVGDVAGRHRRRRTRPMPPARSTSGDQRSVVFVGEALSDAAALGNVAMRRPAAPTPTVPLAHAGQGHARRRAGDAAGIVRRPGMPCC